MFRDDNGSEMLGVRVVQGSEKIRVKGDQGQSRSGVREAKGSETF